MIPTRTVSSRYARAARRSLRARKVAVAALVLVPGVACGNNDAEVFESANTEQPTATSPTPSPSITSTPLTSVANEATATTTSIAAATTPATTTLAATTTELPEQSAAFPASAELVVSFSYTPATSGARGVENPYVAVWVEDLDGNLVQTISLWYEQSGRGGKWLSDLPQWYSASGQASDVTMSSATRVAGDYAVAWDGSGLDGEPVVGGDYLVFVEAAREHGPYQITSQLITIGSDAFTVQLADDGELSNVSASLIA